jgi:predicted nucleic acid-binding protein
MFKSSPKRRDKKDNIFPQPLELESNADYIDRVSRDSFVLLKLGAKNIAVPANHEWQKAKERSLVSITTSEGQFLMFGALVQNW